jgi:hypothetical protein
MGNTDPLMAGHFSLGMASSGLLGIIGMQSEFATGDLPSLLSVSAGHWNKHLAGKRCRYERCALRQQVHEGELLRVEENRQH